jgi:hypothetical protein
VAVNPRARRSPLEGGVHPRARRSLLEGTFEWAALMGRGGYRSVGRAPCVRLSKMRLALVFAGFKRDFPSCFRDPQDCPRQFTKKQRGKNRGKPSQLASLLAGGALGEEMGQARCVPV